ncbi:MAG: hypothetical protein OEW87_15610, partial [Flavobacteriaceae bacterium]|nr:hypothetical protein [Flavobacteriaceae bacterium]
EFAAPNSSYNIIAGTKLFVDSAPTNCYSTAVFGGKYIKVGDYLQIKYYEYDTRWFSIYPVNHCLLQIDKLVEINKDINE